MAGATGGLVSARAKHRRVIIGEEYLDGVLSITVGIPQEFHEYANLVPTELLDRLEQADAAMKLIQDELREHMEHGRRVRNPKYVPDEPAE